MGPVGIVAIPLVPSLFAVLPLEISHFHSFSLDFGHFEPRFTKDFMSLAHQVKCDLVFSPTRRHVRAASIADGYSEA